MNKVIELSKGVDLFRPNVPIYVNRVSEHFHLLEHKHDFMEICYVWEGSGFHYIEDKVLRVSKGDLFVIPIGVSHIFRPASSGQGSRLIVGNCVFEQQVAETIVTALPALVGTFRFRHMLPTLSAGWLAFREQESEFSSLFDRLLREYEQTAPGYQTMLLAKLVELLLLLERRMDSPSPQQQNAGIRGDRMEALLQWMRTRLHEPVRLSSAAAYIGVSERQLSRLLQAHYGQSFSALLSRERMERACELLASSSVTVAEVAQQIGLTDMKHFHKLFRQHTGITPIQYRKQSAAAYSS